MWSSFWILRSVIYHLVPEAQFHSQLTAADYRPSDLEEVGFVHCAQRASVVSVANDYFSREPGGLLLLEIDPARVTAETRFEAPAPIAGGGTGHLATAVEFPHVYGPIDRGSIRAVGAFGRGAGIWAWPAELLPLEAFLAEPRDA